MPVTVTTHELELPTATIAYDLHGPLPTSDGRPPLLMIGQPMDARGFGTLASFFPDRTVITYDPRGLGRSTRRDGSDRNSPAQQADDLHRLITTLAVGPVDLFASSGGAVTSLALVAEHPADVRTLVAHEPPLLSVLPDADQAFAAERLVQRTYAEKGWGAGMAAFIAFSSARGPIPDDFAAPDPSAFGLPTTDDGSRGDPLLSGASDDVTAHRPDVDALRSASTRVVVAAGIESKDLLTWRTSTALADALGTEVAVFPSHHGGFSGPEFGQPGQPEAFAARLREVLAGAEG